MPRAKASLRTGALALILGLLPAQISFAGSFRDLAQPSLLDSVQHFILAHDVLRAPVLAQRHLDQVRSRDPVDDRDLFDALALLAEAAIGNSPRRSHEVDVAFATMDSMVRAGRVGQIEHARLLRLRALRGRLAIQEPRRRAFAVRAESLLAAAGALGTPEHAMVLVELGFLNAGKPRDSLFNLAAEALIRHRGADSDSLWDCLGFAVVDWSGPGGRARCLSHHARVLDEIATRFGVHSVRYAQALYILAAMEIELGLFDRARRHMAAAAALEAPFESELPPWEFGVTYTTLGAIDLELGDVDRALENYERGLAYTRAQAGDSSGHVAYPLESLCAMLLPRGRFEEARKYVEMLGVNEVVRTGPRNYAALNYHDFRARMALSEGDTLGARLAVQERQARQGERRVNRVEYLVSGDLLQSWHAWLSGDAGLAFEHALRGEQREIEELDRQAWALSEEAALAFRYWSQRGLDLALTALRSPETDASQVARAFDLLARSRGRIREIVLERNRALMESTNPATALLLARLRQNREERGRLGSDPASSANATQRGHLLSEEDSLLAALETTEPGFSRTQFSPGIGGLDLLDAIEPDASLVSFVRYRGRDEACGSGWDRNLRVDRYAAFVARGGGRSPVALVDLGPAGLIDSLVLAWRDHVAEPGLDPESRQAALRTLGDSLRRAVLDPVAGNLDPARRLILVPDGMLALLPFDLLPLTTGELIAESGPSIRVLASEQDLAPTAREVARVARLLAVGGADFDQAPPAKHTAPSRPGNGMELLAASMTRSPEGSPQRDPVHVFDTGSCAGALERRFAPLPQSAIEAVEVGELAKRGGVDALVLTGSDASEPAFKRHAPGHAYLHIASHGFWLADSCPAAAGAAGSAMLRSGLVLAGANAGAVDPASGEDGILTAEEIGGLDLRGTRAVVLSACESGLGQGVDWEGLIGLRRAFRTAGAEAVVTSLWKVEDRAARQWMQAFYEDLWAGSGDLSQAGRQATRSMIARERALGREPDPFTCGAFVVTATGPGR